MKVLIAAGGTAGHIMPALRVAEELRERDASYKILFITTRKKQDIEIIRSRNFGLVSIMSGKFRRYFSVLNFIDPVFIFIGFIQSLIIIARFRPNVIFSKGGYSSLPVVFAGRLLFRKIVVHESDLKMGLANRVSAFFADRVLVSFPVNVYPKINSQKLVYTGNPIREIKDSHSLDNDNTVLIMGGSQGALNINNAVFDSLNELLKRYNLIHLTGDEDFLRFNNYKNNLKGNTFERYKVFTKVFGDIDVSRLLNSATLIVSRAGASSIGETAYLGKPLIVIPLSGHQEANADFLVKEKAAFSISDNNLNGQTLLESIDRLMQDKELRTDLSKNISRFSHTDAQVSIAGILESISSKR